MLAKKLDSDGDGLTDEEEWENFSDPFNPDSDQDGVGDFDDEFPGIWHYQNDSDGDGLPDKLELINETNPNEIDSDGDGVIDGIDVQKFDEFRSLAANLSCEGGWERCDQYYYFWKFWDLKYDCNGDGWISGDEWDRTSPDCENKIPRDDYPSDTQFTLDSDNDREPDEIDEDDDNDGFIDKIEDFLGTDSKNERDRPEDSDDDRIPDQIEIDGYVDQEGNQVYTRGTDQFNRDTDGDGAWDGWDDWPLDPRISQDQDKDFIEDWRELYELKTDHEDPDTDGDGVNDLYDDFPLKSWQTEQTFDSGTKDTDQDGLSDEYEDSIAGLDKSNPDSDGDGFEDGPCVEGIQRDFQNGEFIGWYWSWERCHRGGENWYFDKIDNRWYNENSWIQDFFPTDSNNRRDIDGDDIPDNDDPDIDGDGTPNEEDDLPEDPTEQINTDKPTIENGGLTDWSWNGKQYAEENGTPPTNGNGIFGEDIDNDGWIDESRDIGWRFDFVGNNQDQDDDGDSFLDEDEIFSGTDPLDPDSDDDTLLDGVETNDGNFVGAGATGSNPNAHDTDSDGYFDEQELTGNTDPSDPSSKPQFPTPLGFWSFDDQGETVTADLSPNGNNGVVLGNATYVEGHSGIPGDFAIDLDGIDDAVTTSMTLDNIGEFTMAGWIRFPFDQANRSGLFGQNDILEFGFSAPSNVHLWSNPGGALNAPLSPSEDWVHVAFVGDSTGRTIFINGEAVATGAAATPLNASDFFFNIGGAGVFDATGNHFLGQINDVGVWEVSMGSL